MKGKVWLWVLLAVIGVTVVGCLAVVGAGVYLMQRNMSVTPTSLEAAEAEFNRVRARFADQEPLLAMEESGRATGAELQRRLTEAPAGAAASLDGLHLLAWSEEEHRLVSFRIPMWLLRMKAGEPIDLQLDDWDLERLQLTARDMERIGPAVILDHRDARGRVLVWTQ